MASRSRARRARLWRGGGSVRTLPTRARARGQQSEPAMVAERRTMARFVTAKMKGYAHICPPPSNRTPHIAPANRSTTAAARPACELATSGTSRSTTLTFTSFAHETLRVSGVPATTLAAPCKRVNTLPPPSRPLPPPPPHTHTHMSICIRVCTPPPPPTHTHTRSHARPHDETHRKAQVVLRRHFSHAACMHTHTHTHAHMHTRTHTRIHNITRVAPTAQARARHRRTHPSLRG